MRRLKWLSLCTLIILGSTDLSAEGDTRQFNVNPGNMMGGMMNPMRNMFGGYDRNQGRYYDNYDSPYYAPQAYPYYPQGYGAYPGTGYPQAPAGYGAPSAQYPANPYQQPMEPAAQTPAYPEQAAPVYQQPQPVMQPATPYANAPQEQFHFRPMDQQSTVQDSTPPATSLYPQPQTTEPRGGQGYYSSPAPSAASAYPQGYQQQPQVPVDPSMKFRPLDQPGYSQ
ncbi:MAG: hypothetical protein AB2551_05925 [Candidatus Thiodiazotropha sp.]